eukprot:8471160-Pyramimonas_sp.AAC.1
MNDQVAKQVRVIKLRLESGMGVRIPVSRRVMPWVIRHVGRLLARFAARQAGLWQDGLPRQSVVWARVPALRRQRPSGAW